MASAGRRSEKRLATSRTWGKYKLDEDDKDLIEKHHIRVGEHTHKLIASTYWTTINRFISQQKLALPAAYELDVVNWIQVLWDYLSTPGLRLDSEFDESTVLIPETVIIRKARAIALLRSNGHLQATGHGAVDRITKTSLLEPSVLFETLMAAARKLVPVVTPITVVAYLVASSFDEHQQAWVPVVEYMTEDMLRVYLQQRLVVEKRNTLLQVFMLF